MIRNLIGIKLRKKSTLVLQVNTYSRKHSFSQLKSENEMLIKNKVIQLSIQLEDAQSPDQTIDSCHFQSTPLQISTDIPPF